MQIFEEEQLYDIIYIGTGVIPSIEAYHQSRNGKKVIMIEKNDYIGGAWTTVDLFGYTNVENAIHYFLPDKNGFHLMKNVFHWGLVLSHNKFRVFNKKIWGKDKISYDHPFAETFNKKHENAPLSEIIKTLIKNAKSFLLKDKKLPSMYLKNGSNEIIQFIKSLLDSSSIKISTSSPIQSIFIDKQKSLVEVTIRNKNLLKKVHAKKICITHGSVLESIQTPNGPYYFDNKKIPRPAAHILIRDAHQSDILEAVFSASSLIKYCHNITRFSKNMSENKNESDQIFVLALKHELTFNEGIFQKLFDEMKKYKVIGANSTMVSYKWWDVFLPSLFDIDLNKVEEVFPNHIITMKTEDLPRCLGLNIEKWLKTFESKQGAL